MLGARRPSKPRLNARPRKTSSSRENWEAVLSPPYFVCHPLEGSIFSSDLCLPSGRKIMPVGPISRHGHIRVEGDVVPMQIESITPTKKRDQVTQLAFRVLCWPPDRTR